jgi:hypothetical protein
MIFSPAPVCLALEQVAQENLFPDNWWVAAQPPLCVRGGSR